MSGLVVLVLGVWGGLIPFIGPYFHYAFGGYHTWHYTAQRLWLDIVPGAVAVLGGLMLMRASSRVGGLTAGWVAVAAGAWFAVGPSVSLLWHHTIYAIGTPAGGNARQMLEWVGYFYGLGALIIAFAAFAMGRYYSRPRVVEETAVVAGDAVAVAEERHAERHGTTTRAAVADRSAVADAPAEPVRATDAPTERVPVTDAPTQRVPVTDASTQRATDAPVADTRATDAPATAVPTTTTGPATTATTAGTRRRSGGLFGRFRR